MKGWIRRWVMERFDFAEASHLKSAQRSEEGIRLQLSVARTENCRLLTVLHDEQTANRELRQSLGRAALEKALIDVGPIEAMDRALDHLLSAAGLCEQGMANEALETVIKATRELQNVRLCRLTKKGDSDESSTSRNHAAA